MWKLLYLGMVYIHHVTSNSVIRVSGGLLSGVQLPVSQGQVMAFLGVPYAKAPLGNLRFQKPDVAVKWTDIHNATTFGPNCMQSIESDELELLKMSENCLFLNIYVPDNINTTNNYQLPVVVIVHPGNFQEGSGGMIDGKSISVSNHVIVVTFNFRLGIFGFLSLSGHYPGNAGLMDQVAVLQWVKQNIAHFNGNPKNVVLICDYFTSLRHISSKFSGLYEKVITYNSGVEFGNTNKTNIFFESNHIRQRCRSIGLPLQKCLLQLDASFLLNSSTNYARRQELLLFWPVHDHNFPDIAYGTISGVHISSVNIADLIITDIPFFNQRDSHLMDCDAADFDDLSRNVVEILTRKTDERSKQILLKTLKAFYYSEQSNCSGLLTDYLWSSILSFTNSYYTKGLTLLISSERSDSKDRSLATTLLCVLTNCSTNVQSVSHALAEFLRYGYPTFSDDRIVWRPYTPMSKNYLSIRNGNLATGDASSWPFHRLELLWFELLPLLGVKNASGKNEDRNRDIDVPHNTCVTSYAEEQWGLSSSQLEAFLFSLILVTLFLLVIVTALFRILCHFRGRKFYKARSQGKKRKTEEMPSNHVGTQNHVVKLNHIGTENNTRSRNSTQRDSLTEIHCHSVHSTTPL
ncbi:neuroligin-1-like [Ylistrum balloti]|uniref:neuroligin-1-like n=1 Tax=Ylistrum balloti TaxID=509963 RepID=UPI0029058329|nr:neuroligin-1-like [Ylistrum balloti]